MTTFIDWKDIQHNGKKRSTCPNCSHTRKNKKDKCLAINHDKGTAYCHHCEAVSFKEDIEVETKKDWKLPVQTWKNYTDLSDKLVKWLESRGIMQSTAIDLNWTEERYYQPQMGKECNNLVFNYFEGRTLVNKKYRSGNKAFTQSTGTKSIFYNINSIIGKEKVYIVEGEFDVAAMHQEGFKSVISVPNGANDNDNYWQNSEQYLSDVKEFVIGVDNDNKGIKLRDSIAQRLGRYRCTYIEWKGKDANDDLLSGDLKKSVSNAKRFPVNGTFTMDDLFDGVMDLYDNGLPKTIYPKSNVFGQLRYKFSVLRGQLTVVTGIPSHGKSNFVDWYVLNLINDYDMKASWFTPEHSPMELYKTNLMQKVIGKNFWSDKKGERITKQELEQYREWANQKIYLTDCTQGEFPTWDWLFDKFKEQMYSFGIDIFVIDAFNKVLLPKGDKLSKINEVLTKLVNFAQSNNVIVFLVAHPTKMQKKEDGTYSKPTLYDVSGSADFRNQTHNGFTIYRHFDENPRTEFVNTKTKYNFQGEIGASVDFYYCDKNGRYYTNEEPLYNMITKEDLEIPKLNLDDEIPF